MTHRVLFVCTGNICRSPTAEAVFASRARAAGLTFEADSAGTHGYHIGEAPDPRAEATGRARGYDLSDLRARRIQPDDFTRFDLVLAMDRGHLSQLRRLAPPGTGDKVRLFLSFAAEAATQDVPDPYYGGSHDFDRVVDLVERGVDGLIDALESGDAGP